MKKRGFTLIEIIVSIAIIALIGVGSFVGVRYINEKIRINKLSQITDKVLNAAEVYLETNSEASEHLYQNKEGVVIPLKLLVNDGLLDLKTTDIKESDYEKEYVITALGNTQSSEKCVTITTNASWNLSATTPLYICTDNNGNSNLKTIDQGDYTNRQNTSNDTFYFRGASPNNYAKFVNTTYIYRILSIEPDDSLNITSSEDKLSSIATKDRAVTYGNNGAITVTPISYVNQKTGANLPTIYNMQYSYLLYGCENGRIISNINVSGGPDNYYITLNDYQNTGVCSSSTAYASNMGYRDDHYTSEALTYNIESWIFSKAFSSAYTQKGTCYSTDDCYRIIYNNSANVTLYKYHLKSCVKINQGSGTISDPFILKSDCK